VPFAPFTGVEGEGCEVARRRPFVFADVGVFWAFDRLCGTSLPLLDESAGGRERYAAPGDGATGFG
jgi:hypothetical protein